MTAKEGPQPDSGENKLKLFPLENLLINPHLRLIIKTSSAGHHYELKSAGEATPHTINVLGKENKLAGWFPIPPKNGPTVRVGASLFFWESDAQIKGSIRRIVTSPVVEMVVFGSV